MRQLSGLDAAFLYIETGNMPMHIGGLSIYDQSTAPGGRIGFKDILRFFEQRLHRARAFRERLARVPLGLDHPYWIDDPDFDLEFHLRHIALPAPGDWRQLCIQTARLHARPLDTSRPLWEAWVIEGLDSVEGVPPGSFAMVTKIHHAAVDGVSAAEIAAALHDLSPDAAVSQPDRPWNPERFPSSIGLVARSVITAARQPLEFGKFALRNAPAATRLVRDLFANEVDVGFTVPRTRFNDNVSAHRVFDGRSFSLDEIRELKSGIRGTTVNDVVVSVCGGALRKYLQSKNELPDEPLVAMAPVSVRPDSERRSAGNLVTTMSLPTGSDIADPLKRLRTVHRQSQRAKKLTRSLGPSLATDAAQFLPSTTTGMLARAYARYGLARHLPPIYNTIVTNVPGAPVPLYSMGCRMVSTYGLGPVAHGLGLFQPVIGYDGQITISAISCREMMPDPAFYCDCLQESFEELKSAVAKRRKKSSARKKKLSKRGTAAGKKPDKSARRRQ